MGTRRTLYWTGLLIFIFLFITPALFSQESRRGVSVTITPEVIIARSPFTVSIQVDNVNPEDVSIYVPDYHENIILDRYLRFTRGTGSQIQTVTEYRYIVNTAGIITLGEFTVISPRGTVKTETIILDIRIAEDGPIIITPRLTWENVPRQTAAGERLTLVLRAEDDRPESERDRYPPPSFFMPEVPKGVILSSASISSQERENGILLKLTLIPLEPGNFILPARVLRQNDMRFEIPRLNIQVTERRR